MLASDTQHAKTCGQTNPHYLVPSALLLQIAKTIKGHTFCCRRSLCPSDKKRTKPEVFPLQTNGSSAPSCAQQQQYLRAADVFPSCHGVSVEGRERHLVEVDHSQLLHPRSNLRVSDVNRTGGVSLVIPHATVVSRTVQRDSDNERYLQKKSRGDTSTASPAAATTYFSTDL